MITPRLSSAISSIVGAALAVAVAAPLLDAQVVERRPRASDDGPVTNFAGGSLTYADPRGDFAQYVNGAFGITGHFLHTLDAEGIVAIRADLGYLNYGQVTRRQPLGGGALGLITVDVTTSNNIVFGGLGLQLMAPSGPVRPYVNGSAGFSYFFTTSSVEGSSNSQPFADSQNFSDGGFSTIWGGGLYVPFRTSGTPISLDLGVQSHKNPDIQYLNKNSIYVKDTSTPPVITPIRGPADFLTFRLGVTVGLR
ncbi:MAG: hypothetical protein U9Q74_03955, partial [Gemmatimonadota bacterium]|nr:hypothetical protein [Gemmatimonadota bacterium]